MSKLEEQSPEEFHKGTTQLEELAKEVEEGRVRIGKADPGDDADGAEAKTREDHVGASGPLEGEVDGLPVGSFNQVPHRGGHRT